jgi:hypothetical protein
MPNWNISSIAITLPYHDEADSIAKRQVRWEIWRDLKYYVETEHDGFEPFNILRPRPADQDDNWHQWNTENWGTKWDLRRGAGFVEDETIFLDGRTAWSPPIVLLDYLSDELGFHVEAQHLSWESGYWGDTVNGITERWDMYSDYIEVGDEDSDVANKIFEWECNNERELRETNIMSYLMYGEFDHPRYRWLGDFLEGNRIIDYFEDTAVILMNHYDEWKQEHSKVVSSPLRELRHKVMEIIEEANDSGKINEGQYLTLCNEVRTISVDRLNDIIDTLSNGRR